mgnify:CR=1 FL=1
MVHCHVRDPQSGAPSRDPALYREVTERIRDSQTDVILNLTAGMGGEIAAAIAEEAEADPAGEVYRAANVIEQDQQLVRVDACLLGRSAEEKLRITDHVLVERQTAGHQHADRGALASSGAIDKSFERSWIGLA